MAGLYKLLYTHKHILNNSPIRCHTVKQAKFAHKHATDCTEHDHKANNYTQEQATSIIIVTKITVGPSVNF